MTPDERLTAHLLFADELAGGEIVEGQLDRPEVRSAVAGRRSLSPPSRLLERAAMKLGLLDYERRCVLPFDRARRAVLGEAAAGPPRLLVRVDEFPHARAWDEPSRYGTDAFRRFHEILATAGVPYLLAVSPRVSRRHLDPAGTAERELDDREVSMVEQLRSEGVAFAAHGWSHRTDRARAQRRSELAGLAGDRLEELLDRIERGLAEVGVAPAAFVPPFNRFDADQYNALARRYEIVCGGPETVAVLGYRRTPIGLAGTAYVPGYAPLYGRAADVLPAVARLAELRAAVWVPIVLHWGWEADDGWEALRRLAVGIGPLAVPWSRLLEALQGRPETSDGTS